MTSPSWDLPSAAACAERRTLSGVKPIVASMRVSLSMPSAPRSVCFCTSTPLTMTPVVGSTQTVRVLA